MSTRCKISILFLIMGSSILFMGCPVSTKYPLAPSGQEEVDVRLLGTWKHDSAGKEANKITIEKRTEDSYTITVNEIGEYYMPKSSVFVGYTTTINGHHFMVLSEAALGSNPGTFWQYHFEIVNGQLKTNDFTLKGGGIDAIQSTETYRDQVKVSMQHADFLTGEILWSRQ